MQLDANLSLSPEEVAIAIQALGYGLHAQRVADAGRVRPELPGALVVALLRGLSE